MAEQLARLLNANNPDQLLTYYWMNYLMTTCWRVTTTQMVTVTLTIMIRIVIMRKTVVNIQNYQIMTQNIYTFVYLNKLCYVC